MISPNILYEDNHIIVVLKPAGVLSQADNTHDDDMLTIIKEYLKEKYQKTGNVYLGLVHRLDRMTEGIMVFAKTSKAAKRLNEAIISKMFHKSYLAIVNSNKFNIPLKGRLTDYIKRDEKTGISSITNSENGKLAVLEYEVLEIDNNNALIKINLITGRHHQIRVQFASRNMPLLGDVLYGPQVIGKLALYAYELSFPHPITKNEMNFIVLPKDSMWQKYITCINKLKGV